MIDLNVNGLVLGLSYNEAKERAIVTAIESDHTITPAELQSDFPGIACAIRSCGARIGKLYLTLPEDFYPAAAAIGERYLFRPETVFPSGYLRKAGNDVASTDFCFYNDPCRLGDGYRIADIRHQAENLHVIPLAADHEEALNRDGYHIRRAIPQDSKDIAAVMLKVLRYNDDFPLGVTPDDVADLFCDDTFIGYIVERDGIVAFATAYDSPVEEHFNGLTRHDFTLDSVVVDQEHRGNRLGSMLARKRIEDARRAGKIFSTLATVYDSRDGRPDMNIGAYRGLVAAGGVLLGVSPQAYSFRSDLSRNDKGFVDTVVVGWR